MIAKLTEAVRLLGQHLGLFTAIILTVWLPGNLLVNFVAYNLADADEFGLRAARLSMWIEGIFGPIYIGALVYALFEIKSGRSITYRKAIAVGFKKWGSLFAARFVAGLLMGLGLIAFIIPGVILALRYAFVDQAVIIEGEGTAGSRARSVELTAGRRWQILGAGVLFYFPFLALTVGLYLPLGFFEELNIMPVEVVLDCILDIAFAVIQIAIFLFYWEATEDQRRGEAGETPDGDSARPWNAEFAPGLPNADDNPYRSPAS